jgi:hypothetical protein
MGRGSLDDDSGFCGEKSNDAMNSPFVWTSYAHFWLMPNMVRVVAVQYIEVGATDANY